MVRLFVGTLLLACASEPPVPLEQACAEGQRATPAWPESSLAELWDRSRDTDVAVLARRTSTPELVDPTYFFLETPTSEPVFYTCVESAEHQIVDGLGWVDAESITVTSTTGEGFLGTKTGRPRPDLELMVSEHFYADHLAIATDEDACIRWRT